MNLRFYIRLRKWLVVITWLYFLYMAYMLFHPKPPVPQAARYVFHTIHFCAFAVLGGLVGIVRQKWSTTIWVLILLAWSIGSEIIQNFTGRYCEVCDMIQNAVGISVGLLGASFVRRVLKTPTFAEEKGEND